MKVDISPLDLQHCHNYAKLQVETSIDEYTKRGQKEPDTVIRQITEGKIAELGAYAFLQEHYDQPVTTPDFRVYPKRRKSYAPDMISETCNFHVKGQSETVAKRLGTSWVFERNDPLVLTPSERDFVILCVVAADFSWVRVCGMESAVSLKAMYRKLKVEHLNRTKVALYHKTLKKYNLAA